MRGYRNSPASWLNFIFLALCAYATLFPFVNIIATSFSSQPGDQCRRSVHVANRIQPRCLP